MSDGGEEDLSSVAWPGFVDILSAVIIIFVFFVMIISLVLYHHMITYKARVITQIEEQFKKEKESQTSTEEKDSDEAVADMIATIEVLEKQLKAMEEDKTVMEQVISDYKQEFYQARAEFDESEDQILKLLPEENAVIVFFDKQSISLTAEVKETLAQIINEKISEFGSDQLAIRIESSLSPAFKIENSARQLSVARMFNVRNLFLDSDLPSAQITPTLVDGFKIDENFNWVKVIFKNK